MHIRTESEKDLTMSWGFIPRGNGVKTEVHALARDINGGVVSKLPRFSILKGKSKFSLYYFKQSA